MPRSLLIKNRPQRLVAAGLASVALLGLGGCAGEGSKSSLPVVTPTQVHGHADRAFEMLNQEESDRGITSSESSY